MNNELPRHIRALLWLYRLPHDTLINIHVWICRLEAWLNDRATYAWSRADQRAYTLLHLEAGDIPYDPAADAPVIRRAIHFAAMVCLPLVLFGCTVAANLLAPAIAPVVAALASYARACLVGVGR